MGLRKLLQQHTREINTDGSVWFIVHEYGDPWLFSRTRLSNLTFVVQQETEYADHVKYRKSFPGTRDLGPVATNIDDICKVYSDSDKMRVRELKTFGGNTRIKYMSTDDNEVLSDHDSEMCREIRSALHPYSDLPVSNLVREVTETYPEYSKRVNEW